MFRKILLILSILFAPLAHVAATHAAEMVNVEYIHKLIERDWGVKIPYNPKLENPKVAANMKYLLTAIDVANYKLNGKKTTDYGNGEFATMYAADTIATNKAVRTLIKEEKSKYPFTATTMPNTDSFEINLTAKGTFTIDWGDGEVEEIVRTDTEFVPYSHTYSTPGEYTIGIDGQATGYLDLADGLPAITFYSSGEKLAAIDGNLVAVFPTIGDGNGTGQQPSFMMAFAYCPHLTRLPKNLFTGVHGPSSYMFYATFNECTGLTELPDGLFSGISLSEGTFSGTFAACTGLTEIPAGLFAGISGAPAANMFSYTFSACTGLTEIPAGLFAGISGAPADHMFHDTFNGCTGLTGSIPENLFAGISGQPATYMFYGTFNGCSNLSGEIPAGLFGNLSGAPADHMFDRTFMDCVGLTGCVPDKLFSNIDVTLTSLINDYMFYGSNVTEQYCSEYVPNNSPGMDSKFFATTVNAATEFKFNLGAKGTFVVDWGDGTKKIIPKETTGKREYFHRYDAPGEYTVKIGGIATGYDSSSAVQFSCWNWDDDNGQIATIDGSLGAIFPTIGDGSADGQQPNFSETFADCAYMTSPIPENLFAGVKGQPVNSMFAATFRDSGVTGEIPANLFAGISGTPATSMFSDTFSGCSNLSGEIPAGLFGEISGQPAGSMFSRTFSGCSGLTNIPSNLFGNISGVAVYGMFEETFSGCYNLRGESAKIGDKYLYEIWPKTPYVKGCYSYTNGLTDYSSIPSNWK